MRLTETTKAPFLRPAQAAALPGFILLMMTPLVSRIPSFWASSGVMAWTSNPSLFSRSPASSACEGKASTLTGSSSFLPSRRTVSFSSAPGLLSDTALRKLVMFATLLLFHLVMISPCLMPAISAGELRLISATRDPSGFSILKAVARP